MAFFRPKDPFIVSTPHFLGSKFEYYFTIQEPTLRASRNFRHWFFSGLQELDYFFLNLSCMRMVMGVCVQTSYVIRHKNKQNIPKTCTNGIFAVPLQAIFPKHQELWN